ncbi:MAG: hypothetical protein IPP48_00620 [Chitinophagaceae bacterium]|nr:hypothetical protein [Chitinophagaceae bacterium]
MFFLHFIDKPPVYDSNSASLSANNMKASMRHLGYYAATASFNADTTMKSSQKRVHVTYHIKTGKPTLIDTVGYFLRNPTLQEITRENLSKSLLLKNNPVTKASVLGEVSRLVELYRNNGYYKFTADELKVRGDTSIEALTTISDDPFEQLQLLAQAQAKRDSPTIKMAIVLNPPADSSKIKQFYINNIYILPDYQPGDSLSDPTLTERVTENCIVRYHNKLFRTNFLAQSMFLKKGNLYSQADYYKSLGSYSKMGVWQNTNIQIVEVKDSANKIDVIVQLIPGKKYTFEAGIDASFSTNSNTNTVTSYNAGSLLGLSGNLSITNRNVHKEAIKMINAIRGGVEINLNSNNRTSGSAVNSNELSYTNNIVFPRFIFPVKKYNNDKRIINSETFINTNLSYINRINLFKLQSVNFALGYAWSNYKQRKWSVKPLSVEFVRLYNETPEFLTTLQQNPFLKYSFNTSLVAGMSANYSSFKINPKHSNKQHSLKLNVEESGFPLLLPLRQLHVFDKYLRQFIKADVEYIHSVSLPKSALVFRLFGGVGVSSRGDTTLPFLNNILQAALIV